MQLGTCAPHWPHGRWLYAKEPRHLFLSKINRTKNLLWENSDSFHEITGRSYGYCISIFIYCATRTIGIQVGGWQWYICTTLSVQSPIRSCAVKSIVPKRVVGGGYGSIATNAREQEVSDQLLRGLVYCFFDLALNERDTLLVRGRTTSAPGPSPFGRKFAAMAHAGLQNEIGRVRNRAQLFYYSFRPITQDSNREPKDHSSYRWKSYREDDHAKSWQVVRSLFPRGLVV